MKKYSYLIFSILIALLAYTRLVNLSWGLPYPFHPDERNMAVAIQNLNCGNIDFFQCLNPHFFAYGQPPLYLAYLMVIVTHLLKDLPLGANYIEATIALRIISAAASIVNVWVLMKIIGQIINKKNDFYKFLIILVIIFSPYFIQFSHFGTTESLLMLFYSLIVYLTLQLTEQNPKLIFLAVVSGLAIATKVSSAIFMAVPVVTLFANALDIARSHLKNKSFLIHKQIVMIIGFGLVVGLIALIFSPYNWLSFEEFKNSISYESAVATGALKVFYTRQFEGTIPVFFQLRNIFPYVLGWPIYILSVCGFFLLPYARKYNILRIAFLIYFLPTAFLYAKWARFMAPILPIMSVFAILFIFHLKNVIASVSETIFNHKILLNLLFSILILASVIPGIAYLSIYQNADVRFQASNWIYKNIPNGSHILSETANVVDIPMPAPNSGLRILNNELPMYQINSFNFYDVDVDPNLQNQLQNQILTSDYIFVPSRRLFANLNCNIQDTAIGGTLERDPDTRATNVSTGGKGQAGQNLLRFKPALNNSNNCAYPILDIYYQRLFSGSLGFTQVAQFTSYPKIQLFGKTIIEFPDEQAEETWTVFDHPVVRIFKRK